MRTPTRGRSVQVEITSLASTMKPKAARTEMRTPGLNRKSWCQWTTQPLSEEEKYRTVKEVETSAPRRKNSLLKSWPEFSLLILLLQ